MWAVLLYTKVALLALAATPIKRIRSKNIITDNAKCAPKLHAEISCLNSIRHLDIQFSKIKLYIYRARVDTEHGMARPCPACMAAIKDFGIKNIYYTTDDGMAYENVS